MSIPQVNIKPFKVILKKLTAVEIQKHAKRVPIIKTVEEQVLLLVSIKLHKLQLAPNQESHGCPHLSPKQRLLQPSQSNIPTNLTDK